MSPSFSKVETQATPEPKRRRPSCQKKTMSVLENFLVETNWKHVAFKICAYSYLAFILWITWHVGPLGRYWTVPRQTDGLPIVRQDFANYFGQFEGFEKCGIRASDIYIPPAVTELGLWRTTNYCTNRAQLLEAMSTGGRVGFDAPYSAKGCQYRWYSVAETCAILDRFDGLVFVGDSTLQAIYNGLNILLRQDLSRGALKSWELSEEEASQCQCEHQFTQESCSKHFALSSEEVIHHVGGKHQNSYTCQRTPHAFLPINKSPAPEDVIASFKKMVPTAPPSQYKAIPIIHSLTLPNDLSTASNSLTEFLNLADSSGRKTPMLWIGSPAAGHIEVKGRKGNQDVWHFDREMSKIAAEKDVEVLRMWNMTVQAVSWDGLRFGEKVAITQAMMVMNWLARLESS